MQIKERFKSHEEPLKLRSLFCTSYMQVYFILTGTMETLHKATSSIFSSFIDASARWGERKDRIRRFFPFLLCHHHFRVSVRLIQGCKQVREARPGCLGCSCCWEGHCLPFAFEANSGSSEECDSWELPAPHSLGYKGTHLPVHDLSFAE